MNRRDFLRGRSNGDIARLRPPWALDEQRFLQLCTRCQACVEQCPQQIVRRGDGGFPRMDFSKGGCTFCGQCMQACKPGALQAHPEQATPWALHATLNQNCLSGRGVICHACAEICEQNAIRFQRVAGGSSLVRVETQLCTGCGECVAVCPVNAIEIQTAGDPHATRE